MLHISVKKDTMDVVESSWITIIIYGKYKVLNFSIIKKSNAKKLVNLFALMNLYPWLGKARV